MIGEMAKKQRQQQRSTLAEVARAAGVSVATASRALNGDNGPLRAAPAARAQKIVIVIPGVSLRARRRSASSRANSATARTGALVRFAADEPTRSAWSIPKSIR